MADTNKGKINTGFAKERSTPLKGVDLNFHRDYITSIGEIIAGRMPIKEDEDYLVLYRPPNPDSLRLSSLFNNPPFGRLSTDETDAIMAHMPDESIKEVLSLTLQNRVDFLVDLIHQINTHRRQLAIAGNRISATANSQFSAPSGALGGLIKEYDHLLSQVDKEYWYLKDKNQN